MQTHPTQIIAPSSNKEVEAFFAQAARRPFVPTQSKPLTIEDAQLLNATRIIALVKAGAQRPTGMTEQIFRVWLYRQTEGQLGQFVGNSQQNNFVVNLENVFSIPTLLSLVPSEGGALIESIPETITTIRTREQTPTSSRLASLVPMPSIDSRGYNLGEKTAWDAAASLSASGEPNPTTGQVLSALIQCPELTPKTFVATGDEQDFGCFPVIQNGRLIDPVPAHAAEHSDFEDYYVLAGYSGSW